LGCSVFLFLDFRETIGKLSYWWFMPVRLCVCPSVQVKQLCPHWTKFRKVFYSGFFFCKICRSNSVSVKPWKSDKLWM